MAKLTRDAREPFTTDSPMPSTLFFALPITDSTISRCANSG
ncbi:Uncharacterised protein [Vibrio cholerae]|nr:Uncharacterised protein [Vibrio cholerae]